MIDQAETLRRLMREREPGKGVIGEAAIFMPKPVVFRVFGPECIEKCVLEAWLDRVNAVTRSQAASQSSGDCFERPVLVIGAGDILSRHRYPAGRYSVVVKGMTGEEHARRAFKKISSQAPKEKSRRLQLSFGGFLPLGFGESLAENLDEESLNPKFLLDLDSESSRCLSEIVESIRASANEAQKGQFTEEPVSMLGACLSALKKLKALREKVKT